MNNHQGEKYYKKLSQLTDSDVKMIWFYFNSEKNNSVSAISKALKIKYNVVNKVLNQKLKELETNNEIKRQIERKRSEERENLISAGYHKLLSMGCVEPMETFEQHF
nr:MAG TPA: hypothetical protein [Caudoviricetes sp.]